MSAAGGLIVGGAGLIVTILEYSLGENMKVDYEKKTFLKSPEVK